MGTGNNKRNLRVSKGAKRPVNNKNIPHEHSGAWITTGHNSSDADFLEQNKELLRKLQQ